MLTFDLGSEMDVSGIVVWNYRTDNRNSAKSFTLSFATASSTGPFSGDISPADLLCSAASNAALARTFSPTTARYVRMTITNNQIAETCVSTGGDRVGLGEIRFLTSMLIAE